MNAPASRTDLHESLELLDRTAACACSNTLSISSSGTSSIKNGGATTANKVIKQNYTTLMVFEIARFQYNIKAKTGSAKKRRHEARRKIQKNTAKRMRMQSHLHLRVECEVEAVVNLNYSANRYLRRLPQQHLTFGRAGPSAPGYLRMMMTRHVGVRSRHDRMIR